jgi:hypothetical protein
MRPVVLALCLLALRPHQLPGQSFSLNAQGTVASAVAIARLGDLSFGATAIVPGTGSSVTPANGARIRVDYNEPTSVTAPGFLMIVGPGGAQLRVDLACAQATTASAPAPIAFATTCAGGFIPPLAGNVGGTHYIYVGGSIGAAATATVPAGSYAGTFSVTASYVNY